MSSSPASEEAAPHTVSDSAILCNAEAVENTSCKRCINSDKDSVNRNVMVLSWLTPTNNQGRFMFSINKCRHSTLLLCQNSSDDENSFQTGIEFTLSVPVRGMEKLILDVGSISGRFGSKFPSSAGDRENDATNEINGIAPTTNLSNRQRKKQKKQQLSLHGVTGLIPVPLGSSHPCPQSEMSPSSLFAIKGTVAHLKCRTYAVIGTPTVADTLTESKDRNNGGKAGRETADSIECDDTIPPVIDHEHLLVMAEVIDAYVHPSYWDVNKLLFRPLSTDIDTSLFDILRLPDIRVRDVRK